jgi:hypothetical protein
MVLDQQAKGELEKYVDKVMSSPGLNYWYFLMCHVHYKHEEIKNILQYKNEGDFLKGTVYGAIVWGYAERFYALFQRDLTTEEVVEMKEVLVNKVRESSYPKDWKS